MNTIKNCCSNDIDSRQCIADSLWNNSREIEIISSLVWCLHSSIVWCLETRVLPHQTLPRRLHVCNQLMQCIVSLRVIASLCLLWLGLARPIHKQHHAWGGGGMSGNTMEGCTLWGRLLWGILMLEEWNCWVFLAWKFKKYNMKIDIFRQYTRMQAQVIRGHVLC